jgi:hypothetical protein
MPRLFVFAIGGTGARVLKSLTMLLAAGVKPDGNQEFEIVPIIIDPHKSNEDLKRTERLLSDYQAIVSKIGLGNGFFGTSVKTLDNLIEGRPTISGNFTFTLQDVAGMRFKDYIDHAGLNEPNRKLMEVLFSGTSINRHQHEVPLMDLEMDIGFVGNPNIGSIVLNQFRDSEEFKQICSNYNHEDRVFIISSIFGGTGAAGFPIILKNIRNAMNSAVADSAGFLENARIGAVTVMPYFNIQADDKSPIRKADFISKTRSALHYYKENVSGNNSVNALYYIGDDHNGAPYENDPGHGGQKNRAHFVELAAAMSIIDYMSIPDDVLVTQNGKALNPLYKEFFTRNDSTALTFEDLDLITSRRIARRLTQLYMLQRYKKEQLVNSIGKAAWTMEAPPIERTFTNSAFFLQLSDFLKGFEDWLNEQQENKRAFTPYNFSAGLEAFVHGLAPAKTGSIIKRNFDYSDFDGALSRISHSSQTINRQTAESRYTSLFFQGTEEILTKIYKLSF